MLLRTTDPFRDLDRLTQQIFGTTNRPAVMPMDAWREGDRFVIEFDLPGVARESIDLDVERNVLTVRAERVARNGDWEMLASERPRGVFSRQLVLGDNLDLEQIEAAYDGGVLRLTVPVAEKAKPRKIEISGLRPHRDRGLSRITVPSRPANGGRNSTEPREAPRPPGARRCAVSACVDGRRTSAYADSHDPQGDRPRRRTRQRRPRRRAAGRRLARAAPRAAGGVAGRERPRPGLVLAGDRRGARGHPADRAIASTGGGSAVFERFTPEARARSSSTPRRSAAASTTPASPRCTSSCPDPRGATTR